MIDSLHWLGHDAFRIDGPPVVYVDPYKLSPGAAVPADLILITHDHFDHLSPGGRGDEFAPNGRSSSDRRRWPRSCRACCVLRAGESLEVAGVKVTAMPAYNTNKKFHPRESGKVGFVFTVSGVTYYHAGDTDLIPEMDGLAPDVALLPVSGTYVMTALEAAQAARRIRPKVAVPMHYGTIVGSDDDALLFARELEGSGIEVVIKPRE